MGLIVLPILIAIFVIPGIYERHVRRKKIRRLNRDFGAFGKIN